MKKMMLLTISTIAITTINASASTQDECDATVRQVAGVLKKNGFKNTQFKGYKFEGEDENRYYTLNFDNLNNFTLMLSNDSSSKCTIIELKSSH